MCFLPESSEVVYGRVVVPPTRDTVSAASPAFLDESPAPSPTD